MSTPQLPSQPLPNNVCSPSEESQQSLFDCDNYQYSTPAVPIPVAGSSPRIYNGVDHGFATPLASPTDFSLDSQLAPCWFPGIPDATPKLADQHASGSNAGFRFVTGLPASPVLSHPWSGHPNAPNGGRFPFHSASRSLSSCSSDFSTDVPLSPPPSDLTSALSTPFGQSPLFPPRRESTDSIDSLTQDSIPALGEPSSPYYAPINMPAPNALQLQYEPFEPLPTEPQTQTAQTAQTAQPVETFSTPRDQSNGILAQLMANPVLWRQANTAKKGIYVCSHCTSLGSNRRFTTLASLAAHFDIYGVAREGKCDYRSCVWSLVGFSSQPEKLRHIRSQHSSKHFKCAECGRAFVRGDSLKRHLRLLHARENTSAADIANMAVQGQLPSVPGYMDIVQHAPPAAGESIFDLPLQPH